MVLEDKFAFSLIHLSQITETDLKVEEALEITCFIADEIESERLRNFKSWRWGKGGIFFWKGDLRHGPFFIGIYLAGGGEI